MFALDISKNIKQGCVNDYLYWDRFSIILAASAIVNALRVTVCALPWLSMDSRDEGSILIFSHSPVVEAASQSFLFEWHIVFTSSDASSFVPQKKWESQGDFQNKKSEY